MLTADQAADFLQTSRDTLLRRARAGKIPAAKLGREWRFRKSELDAWLAAGGDRYEAMVQKGMDLELEERRREDTGERIPWEQVRKRQPANT
ncbi:MAG: helix-turn-helix domain-containing protein [Armatimonadia bacterium]